MSRENRPAGDGEDHIGRTDMIVERADARGHSASRLKSFMASAAIAALTAALWTGPADAADKVIVGLITKTNTNPFFAKMKEGAEAEAKKLGVELQSFAGKYDGDNESQVAAIENLIAAGAKGILLTASDTKAIV